MKSIPIGPRPADDELTLTTTGLAEWSRAPLAPVTVTHEVPVGASAATVTVIVDVPDPAIDCGENDTVEPAARTRGAQIHHSTKGGLAGDRDEKSPAADPAGSSDRLAPPQW